MEGTEEEGLMDVDSSVVVAGEGAGNKGDER